jgi:hypothetical protein
MWQTSATNGMKAEWFAKATEKGEYYSLEEDECVALMAEQAMPKVRFFNAIEVIAVEATPSIRLYHHATRGTALMWNQLFNLTLRQSFELVDFPFDSHAMKLDLKQDDSRTWDVFDLQLHCVQFHRNALIHPEWVLSEPAVRRVDHKNSVIDLNLHREPAFYLVNVVSIVVAITSFTLVVFAVDTASLVERINLLLTLILTIIGIVLLFGRLSSNMCGSIQV